MFTLSVCMIAKNEAAHLPKSLASICAIADEIVVVDTGSNDATKAVAQKFTDKVYDFEWIDDFSAARNFSFAQATMDYVMWLDADDVLLPEDAAALLTLKETLPPEVDAIRMRYNVGFDGSGAVNFWYYRERIARRSSGFLWREPVHEHLAVGGRVINIDAAITHTQKERKQSDRNLNIYRNIMAQGRQLSPRGQFYYARELRDHALFDEAATAFEAFLKEGKGWQEDNIEACVALSNCRKALGDLAAAERALYQSFEHDVPRAVVCCHLGYLFFQREQFEKAAFWFALALTCPRPKASLGFQNEDYFGYIPAIECAVCHDRLGDWETASHYNELAGQFRPNCASVLRNRAYFEERRNTSLQQ